MADLSDFFKTIAEEKKKQEEEFKSLVGDDIENIIESMFKSPPHKKEKKVEVITENLKKSDNKKTIKEESLIEKSLGFLAEPSDTKVQNDPITPLNQNFVTLDQLNKHYNTFLSRIQQQLSTLGGGGEVNLEFLDDIDRNSAKTDNYFLKYDATLKKWIGDPADGVGITSIVSIAGVTTYYQANDVDDYIGVSANVPVTIVLPQIPSYGKKLVVKDEGNQINTYNITVQAGIGKSVENDISVTMSNNHQSFSFFYNGSNWYIV